jgi:phenylpyruvate tautomerase PptA (4-oxalocrotonate tautomerase family)
MPIIKVAITEIERTRYQTAHIHQRITAKQYTVGVDNKNLSIRVQAAEQAAGFGAGDAVQGDSAAVGLIEDNGFVGGTGEGVPVNGYVLGVLLNRSGGTILRNAATATGDYAPVGAAKAVDPTSAKATAKRLCPDTALVLPLPLTCSATATHALST